jgi:hypothetical protein
MKSEIGPLTAQISLTLPLRVLCLIVIGALTAGATLSGPRTDEPPAALRSKLIVIGFVGFILKHDDLRRGEVQLAARLRNEFPDAVVAQVFANTKCGQAHSLILHELNTLHAKHLSQEQKSKARIIIYGHSWGASEAVALAGQLKKEGIPVLLTAQVDSVMKIGEDDGTIPSNVREAVNFFQRDGALRGRSSIHAEDPSRTKILGNIRMDYTAHPITCPNYPWFELTVAKTHSQIECDPAVWGQIESMIRDKIAMAPPAMAANGSQSN